VLVCVGQDPYFGTGVPWAIAEAADSKTEARRVRTFIGFESEVRFNRTLLHKHRVVSVDGVGNNPLHGRRDANPVVVRLDRTDTVKV